MNRTNNVESIISLQDIRATAVKIGVAAPQQPPICTERILIHLEAGNRSAIPLQCTHLARERFGTRSRRSTDFQAKVMIRVVNFESGRIGAKRINTRCKMNCICACYTTWVISCHIGGTPARLTVNCHGHLCIANTRGHTDSGRGGSLQSEVRIDVATDQFFNCVRPCGGKTRLWREISIFRDGSALPPLIVVQRVACTYSLCENECVRKTATECPRQVATGRE